MEYIKISFKSLCERRAKDDIIYRSWGNIGNNEYVRGKRLWQYREI